MSYPGGRHAQRPSDLSADRRLCHRGSAATAEGWHDPSPHQIRFVTVQPDVKIETLDWGGTGRPLILIAGAGGTAHTFADFAPLLPLRFHVYGVSRRGYGDCSRPRSGYDADALGDDVIAVIRMLKLQKPILMGHSFGGQEVSDVATRYPALIAGAIYLDAMYSYDAAADKEALYWECRVEAADRGPAEAFGRIAREPVRC
jgi:non-heme chloroperoxidase